MPAKYLLWDASVVVPYYVPQATRNAKVPERSRTILDSIRNHRYDGFCYLSNVVIAEVFASFARECYSGWDAQVYKRYGGRGKTLDTRRYNSAVTKFHADIHNGALFYQVEVNRHHVLALDLIAPVDKHRKFYRKGNVRSMGASDLLLGAISLHLVKIHGHNNVIVLTADARMGAIFSRACPELNPNTANKLNLTQRAEELTLGPWRPEIYPKVLDLQRCTVPELEGAFGFWPLKTRKTRGKRPKA